MYTDDVPKGKVLIDIADAWEAVHAMGAYRRDLLAESRKSIKKGMSAYASLMVRRADMMIEVRSRIEEALLEDSRAKAARDIEAQS